MKRIIDQKDFLLTVLLASMLLAALLMSGCAGGPTQESTGEYIDDAAISAKVKTELFRDPDVSGFQTQVESYKGQVQLSGFVDTPEQKAKAAEIARSIPGVKSVKNNLIVKSK